MSLIDLLGGASVAVPSNGAWTPLYGLNRVFIGYVFVELGEVVEKAFRSKDKESCRKKLGLV